jgi:hypothetical protein
VPVCLCMCFVRLLLGSRPRFRSRPLEPTPIRIVTDITTSTTHTQTTNQVPTDAAFYEEDGIAFKSLPGVDAFDFNVMVFWPEAREFIDACVGPDDDGWRRGQPKGRVLVHCHAGINRSGAIALAYMMWKRWVAFL